jgi:hypothetical protein
MASGFIAGLPAETHATLEPLLKIDHRERGTKLFAHADQIDFVWFPHAVNWSRLSEQLSRVDKWSVCRG